MGQEHTFACKLVWTGAERGPLTDYASYSREYVVEMEGKPPIRGSAAPVYRGDASLHNPEDWLVAALSGCHCLSYLAHCARAGIVVVAYEDAAFGRLALRDGKMRFTEVTLSPKVTILVKAGQVKDGSDEAKAHALHEKAHADCFIANSVNFPVRNEPTILVQG
ncbi:OsmC family protein [Pendulispora brunnea]|uniref:OsmC family protein n=1 Tax=Pendulispora brunnea TaxID=2905690 RepID=A0ABZ2KRN7_9BACT